MEDSVSPGIRLQLRLLPKPECSEMRFQQISWKFESYTRNEAHKQYSLVDTILNSIFYVGPPGTHL